MNKKLASGLNLGDVVKLGDDRWMTAKVIFKGKKRPEDTSEVVTLCRPFMPTTENRKEVHNHLNYTYEVIGQSIQPYFSQETWDVPISDTRPFDVYPRSEYETAP